MARITWGFGIISGLLLGGQYVWGHERWVPHDLLQPVQSELFFSPSWDMLSIIGRTLLVLAATAGLWYLRRPLQTCLVGLSPQCCRGWVRNLASFMFDESLESARFRSISQYFNKFAVRVPAIVLMYSAATNSLMMPSFPLQGEGDAIFKYLQVALGLMIIMELLLPLVGYTLCLLFLYTLGMYGPVVAVDALPILALAYVYITMPPRSGARALTIRHTQVIPMRMILGVSFCLLGMMKILNHELIIGVADHNPDVMADPMIQLFWVGTDPRYAREWWAFGFGMSEMLTGFLLIVGMFKRLIGLFVSVVFTKLMIYDIGWLEIPHLYPISVLLIICFSNLGNPATYGRQRRASDHENSAEPQWSETKHGPGPLPHPPLTTASEMYDIMPLPQENCLSPLARDEVTYGEFGEAPRLQPPRS